MSVYSSTLLRRFAWACALALTLSAAALAQDNTTTNTSASARTVASGQKMTLKGVVTRRDADTFVVQDANGVVILDHDEFIRPQTTLEGLGALKLSFDRMGEMGFDAVAIQRYPQVERIKHVHTPGNSSGIGKPRPVARIPRKIPR